MTKTEALRMALEALENTTPTGFNMERDKQFFAAITALRERLAQPEFPTHEEGDDGWSDWVCPDPKSYLMKCCECGLVHEAQFGVVRYKSETEREDCEKVGDPNLQAVFRMRRSEQWSPVDTAHRAGGLPMEQPAQQPVQEPVAWMDEFGNVFPLGAQRGPKYLNEPMKPLYTTPPHRKPLSDEMKSQCPYGSILQGAFYDGWLKAEAAHGIKD